MKYWIILIALTSIACGSDDNNTKENDPGDCEEITIEGKEYCAWKQKIIVETGYDCPENLSNFHNVNGLGVCTDSADAPPKEIKEKIEEEFTNPKALTCKSMEVEVNDKDACLKDGKTCYELSSGKWCTESCCSMPPKFDNCRRADEIEVATKADCTSGSDTCYELTTKKWCTTKPLPIACMDNEDEVASSQDCGGVSSCYELASGKWCKARPVMCQVGENEVVDENACLADGICYELANHKWCTAPKAASFKYFMLKDTTVGAGCSSMTNGVPDPGSDLMYISLENTNGDNLSYAITVDTNDPSPDNGFADDSILDGNAPTVNAIGCVDAFTDLNIYSMGCGGTMLFKFKKVGSDAPLEVVRGERAVVVGEYGSTCGGSGFDSYKLFGCTDDTKAASGDISSCTVSIGDEGTGLVTYPLTK